MSRRVAAWRLHRRTTLDLHDLAAGVNLVLRGWFGYFTAFYPSAVIPLCQRVDRHLVRWARWKYKRLERSGRRAWAWLGAVRLREPSCSCIGVQRRSVLLAGRHEPYESRGSRADLWGPAGAIPAGYRRGRERDTGARIEPRPSKGKSRGRLASSRRLLFDTSSTRAPPHNLTPPDAADHNGEDHATRKYRRKQHRHRR